MRRARLGLGSRRLTWTKSIAAGAFLAVAAAQLLVGLLTTVWHWVGVMVALVFLATDGRAAGRRPEAAPTLPERAAAAAVALVAGPRGALPADGLWRRS